MASPGNSVALRARRLAGRVVRRAARPALAGPGSPVQELRERVERLDGAAVDVTPQVEALRETIARLEAVVPLCEGLDDRFEVQDEARAEVIHALESVRRRVEALERTLQPLVSSASALPFVEGDPFETFEADGAGRVVGFRGADDERADRYVAFEDVFRGSEERIRTLQEPYLEIIGDRRPVLDVGCGRGEFLDLLRDHDIPAIGVDTDEGMVARCQAKGHDQVEQADAVSWLDAAEEGSLGVVFSAQVIEHIPYEGLQRLLSSALRALQPGGLFIAETVNPHAPDALKGFWLDPTHEHPLFPEVMLVLCRSAGFESAYVFHPNAGGDAEEDRFRAPAYAVVATRRA